MARKSRKNNNQQCKLATNKAIYNVGIYVRLSFSLKTKVYKENDTIENQKDIILKYIKDKKEFNLIGIYEDDNKTGTNFDRKGFEKLLEDVRKGIINCIIVKDLSRFGRNYIECGNYLEKIFPFLNVRFIAVNDNYDSNNENSNEVLLMHLKNFMNDIYSRDISKKISTVINEKQKKGEFIGNWACYGYLRDEKNTHKIVINEETAPIIKYIFDLRLKNYGYTKISKILNEKNILSPSAYLYKKGYIKSEKLKYSKWTDNVVKKVLTNEVYIGNLVQGRTKKDLSENKERTRLDRDKWIVVEDTHIPIISKEIFYKVQEINNKSSEKYKSNKKCNNKNNENIFKGYLKCGICGKSLSIQRGIRKTVDNVNYFVCTNRKIGVCNLKSIREEVLKNIVFNEIKNQINIATNLKNIIDKNIEIFYSKQNILKLEIKNINNEINKIKDFYHTIYEDYTLGLLNKDDYIFTRGTYEEKEKIFKERKSILENQLEKLENNLIKENIFITNTLKCKNKKILTKDLLELLIKEILIFDDKTIQITFNYNLGYKEIINTMKDVLENVV